MKTEPYSIRGTHATFAVAPASGTGGLSGKVALWNRNKPGDTVHMTPEEAVRFATAMLEAAIKATDAGGTHG